MTRIKSQLDSNFIAKAAPLKLVASQLNRLLKGKLLVNAMHAAD
jgi:hypothetical protein